jgi:hypothetical protein
MTVLKMMTAMTAMSHPMKGATPSSIQSHGLSS